MWERRTWEIFHIKMKARRFHRVPLSDRAMEIVHEAWPMTGTDGLIFPSEPGGGMVSDMTYNMMMRRLELPAVPHRFRSSFTDWSEELLKGHSTSADAGLVPQKKSKIRQAYKRTDFFNTKIELMQRWADYVALSTCPLPTRSASRCAPPRRPAPALFQRPACPGYRRPHCGWLRACFPWLPRFPHRTILARKA